MHAWEQIQITVEYIEVHLSEEVAIADLAKTASLSEFYYQRLFSRLVKIPVGEYIKLRRLSRASESLLDKNNRILDVALEFGFSSHEVFTRAFKSAFGITPEEYRKKPVRLNQFNKPELLLGYTLIDEGVPLVTDGIVLEITRKNVDSPEYFMGLSTEEPFGQMPTGKEPGADQALGKLWDNFHEKKPNIESLLPNGEEIGVTSMGSKEGYYRYFAGGCVTDRLPQDRCEQWELKKGDYIVCTFEAESFEKLVMDALYKAHGYLFGTWLPKHGVTTKPYSVERYASYSADTTMMEIWVMPVEE